MILVIVVMREGRFIICLFLLLVWCALAFAQEKDSSGIRLCKQTSLVISKKMPSLVLPIEAKDSEEATFLEVEVTDIKNPKLETLTVDVFLEGDNQSSVKVGSFSFYPADHPEVFVIDLKEKASIKNLQIKVYLKNPELLSEEIYVKFKPILWKKF